MFADAYIPAICGITGAVPFTAKFPFYLCRAGRLFTLALGVLQNFIWRQAAKV